ncbi:MAG: sigma-70 family RNA polymerase sigma factor [Verrucomicrobiota bacterium]
MFPTTHWTLLAEATIHGDAQASAALDSFCRRYRPPIVSFIQRHGVPQDQVEDVAHDFLLGLLKHSTLKRADRTKGRFRAYLCTALARFLISRARVSQGPGGQAPLSLDACLENLNFGEPGPPDDAFDRDWAVAMMRGAFEDLAATATLTKERIAAWPVVVKYLLPGQTPPPYEVAAAQLGTSPAALRVDVSRHRARFREFLRERVSQTVGSGEDVDSEMLHLFKVLNTNT